MSDFQERNDVVITMLDVLDDLSCCIRTVILHECYTGWYISDDIAIACCDYMYTWL